MLVTRMTDGRWGSGHVRARQRSMLTMEMAGVCEDDRARTEGKLSCHCEETAHPLGDHQERPRRAYTRCRHGVGLLNQPETITQVECDEPCKQATADRQPTTATLTRQDKTTATANRQQTNKQTNRQHTANKQTR